jgi:hypothetical protein
MKRFVAACLLTFGLVAGVFAQPALAVDPFGEACKGANADTTVCKGTDDQLLGANGFLSKVINLFLTIAGIVAVIAIIIGGIRYTTSGGDQGQIKSAKDTILYAVVGLVVAIMAFAIVNFVIGRL